MRLLPHTACRSVLRRPNWWPTTPMASTVTSRSMARSWKPFKASNIVTDEGSMPEISSRIAQTIAALTKLKIIWDNKNIGLSSKIRLLHSLVRYIFLYYCETWTLTAERERKIQAKLFHAFSSPTFRAPFVSGSSSAGELVRSPPPRCGFWSRERAWTTTQQFGSANFTWVTIKSQEQN